MAEPVTLTPEQQLNGLLLTIRNATEAADKLRKDIALTEEKAKRKALVEVENRMAVIRTLQKEILKIAKEAKLTVNLSNEFEDINFEDGEYVDPDWNSSNCY